MRYITPLLIIGLSIVSQAAYAGAWTQEKGHGQLIVNALYYATDELYNNSGNTTSQPNYSKYELNPYLEYGLADGITIGTNLSLQRAHQDTTPDQTNWGVGDSEFFLRGRLWQHNGFVVSAEPMIKLPSPEPSGDTPKLGGTHPDAGLGLSAGYGFTALGLTHFANIDAGYRYRFDTPEDQIRLAATLGVSATENLIIMPQIFATYRVESPSVVTFTQSTGDDYDLVKLQLSAVYKYNDSISLQGGGFSHIDGKNVGAGSGVVFSVWKRF